MISKNCITTTTNRKDTIAVISALQSVVERCSSIDDQCMFTHEIKGSKYWTDPSHNLLQSAWHTPIGTPEHVKSGDQIE